MTPLSDDACLALMNDLESDRAERRRSPAAGDAAEKIREAACAFANELPNHRLPGVLFIGVNDDGSNAGIDVSDRLLQTLADIKTDGNILPPPTLAVEKRVLQGAPVAVVTVWPADAPPVRYRGRICIRTGPRRGIPTAQDERILNEKRRFRDRSFDTHPIGGCTLSELNQGASCFPLRPVCLR